MPRDILDPDLRLERSDDGDPGSLVVRLFGRRDPRSLGFWSSHPLQIDADGTAAGGRFVLRAGESAWLMLGVEERPACGASGGSASS